jgi:ribosome-binding protein aMBF1 (putative translation factor)
MSDQVMILRKKKTNSIKPVLKIKIPCDEIVPKILPKELGQKILAARNAKKMTQVDLAKKINVQTTVVRNYENGNLIPDRRILRAIAEELQIKLK